MSPIDRPQFEENRTFNLLTSIWIVPLIALILSAWLVYQHFTSLGSEIRIDFANSGNLIAGESVIKFRDVPVGRVIRIELQKGGEGVTVVARMNKEAEPYLNRTTRFWIVKPQVDYSGVRGLDTLLHGAYIEMHAERKGKLHTTFKGLEKPYRSEEEGAYFYLSAQKIDNVYVGAAVYYRDIQVGSIDRIDLSADQQSVQITLFIKRDYVHLINMTTKFWYQDLVSVRLKGDQMVFDLAPLTSILLGGITFESKLDADYPRPDPKHIFRLYGSRSEAIPQRIGNGVEHLVPFRFRFSGEIKGLGEGTSIRYQGFRVGEINKAVIHFNPEKHTMEAETTGTIDTSAFATKEHNGTENLKRAVREGLHAELKSDNPLISKLYINLTYADDVNTTAHTLKRVGDVFEFPTKRMVNKAVLSHLDSLLVSLTALSDENRKPLHDLLVKLKESAEHLNTLMAKPSFQNMTDDLNSTMGDLKGWMGKGGGLDKAMKELEDTLEATRKMMKGYDANSLFGRKLEAMLKEVGKTSEETKRFIERLNKKPNALIFGD